MKFIIETETRRPRLGDIYVSDDAPFLVEATPNRLATITEPYYQVVRTIAMATEGPVSVSNPQPPNLMATSTTSHPATDPAGLLTPAELNALDLTVRLVNLVSMDVIGVGRTRDHDLREFVDHVHAIQNQLLSQAAGRAYPGRFRLLGGVV